MMSEEKQGCMSGAQAPRLIVFFFTEGTSLAIDDQTGWIGFHVYPV
jgi:hypothetical protein